MKGSRLIVYLFAGIVLALLVLLGRCFQLQILRWSYYEEKGLHQQRSLAVNSAPRGVILDARGRILAASNQVRTVIAEPRIIHDPKAIARQLAPVLNIGAHILCKKIMDSKNPGCVKLGDAFTWEQAQAARSIPGVGVQYNWQRYYPMQHLTSHVVGFTSNDGIGQGGIEYQYNQQLVGEESSFRFLVDHRRRPVSFLARTSEDISVGHAGEGVILTLDSTIQQFVREALQQRCEEYEAESGLAIVADPHTGAILAMVSLPDFDPAEAGKMPGEVLRNRAIWYMYEPGSVLKPIVSAIALDAGVVTKSQTIFCENGHYYGKGFGREISEYDDHEYGNLTVKGILVKSSNIGMAKMGQAMGADTLCQGLSLFGFGSKTGINLPGEARGLMTPAKDLKLHSLLRVPFGQGISVTGIQLVRAFCVLANGGHLVQPHTIKAFVDHEGHPIIRDSAYEVAGQVGVIIDPKIAHWMVNDALCAVVEEGTGKRAQLDRWRVFGKTGTGQVPKKDGRGYEDGAYVASFIAGAPVEDPRLVVLVSIHKPNRKLGKGYTGGSVASPVVGKIIDRTLSYYEARGLIASPVTKKDDAI